MRRAAVHVVVLLLRGLSDKATEVGHLPACHQSLGSLCHAPGHCQTLWGLIHSFQGKS